MNLTREQYQALSRLGVAARIAKQFKPDSIEAIKARCAVDAKTGCWNWTGKLTDKGYVRGRVGHRAQYFHRIMFRHAYGGFDELLEVCHKCDNPKCLNPDHLFLGTHADNMRDCAAKNRLNTARGERQPTSKLTAAQVLEIRDSTNSLMFFAKKFGVDISTISAVRTRKNWNWL